MGRSQRLYIQIVTGFFIWFLIFVGQNLYFSSAGIPHHHCTSPACQDLSSPPSSRPPAKSVKNLSASDQAILARIRRQPLLQQYESRHVNFLRLAKPSTRSNRYLIYTCNRPCGGWGDRTRKIVGAYLLSLAVNRTFLINMTWPCPITHLLEPNFVLWNRTVKDISTRTNLTVSTLAATDRDYSDVLSWEGTDIVHFQVKDLGYYSMLLWRDDFYRVLHVQYGLQRSSLFLHTAFTLIYELLFKLKPHPQSHFDDISERFATSSLRCAHIRIGRNPSNPNDVVFPKRERMNTTVIGFLKNHSHADEAIFVSTDSDEVLAYARKQFSTQLLTVDGMIRHIDRSGKKFACDGLEKTILDFYTISQCDTMVMSKSAFRSVGAIPHDSDVLLSFSYWANMRRAKPFENLYLYCDGMKQIRGPSDYDRYPYGQC